MFTKIFLKNLKTYKKFSFNILMLLISHIFIIDVLAINFKNKEPIYIDSLCQKFDLSKKIISFAGMVKIQKGSINILAEKIFFYKNKKEKILIGYGNPIIFLKKKR